MNNFLIALQFLTRLPLNIKIDWQDEKVAASLLWYPAVGVLIGVLVVFVAQLFAVDNAMLAAAITLTVWVIITGGIHLDGLADSADAWVGGYGDKKRALEIMKDPQAGPIAVIVLLVVLLIKFSALYSLLMQSEYWLIMFAIVLGRCVPLFLFLTTPYVREQGLGSAMAKHFPRQPAIAVLVLLAVTILFLSGVFNGFLLISVTLLTLGLLRYLMLKSIDGMTGDTIGAAIEVTEAVVLCVLVLLWV